ncbi:MAG: hypothetical protein IJX78_04295 [Bacilli bacterium]|nr:hypothetical protein [Bacilli bacterium]
MKKKNLVVLLISILFPLLVTGFIGLYTYGSFGNWDKNQKDFINSIFNEETETKTSIENYAKFASSHYLNLSENMTVYSDYQERTVLEPVNGAYTIENKITVSPYALGEVSEDNPYISYMFFLYNLNYNNVNPANIYFICVQGTEDEDYAHLLKAIEQFNNDWVESGATGSAAMTSSRGTPYPIYDIHAVLDEDSDSETTPYAYSITTNRNYTVVDEDGNEDDSINFEKLANCSFAIIETTSESETTVLMSGLMNNIKRNASALASLDNVGIGYGSTSTDELTTLEAAGYFGFVLPTLLLYCGIALLVSGVIAFLFYMVWTTEEEDPKKKFKKSKK